MASRYSFLPFIKARAFSRTLKLKSENEWYSYIKGKNINIPSTPNKTYKTEWINWMDWLKFTFNRSKNNRKYKINENFFKNWSGDMAYVLGLWFADGYLNLKKGFFSITLHKKDKKLLYRIRKSMQSNHKIRIQKNASTLNIYSIKIIEAIKILGGTPCKSLIIKFPSIPKKYFPDFLRGLWDGDGCICYNKHDKYYISTFVSGSKNFAYELFNNLKQILNTKGSVTPFKNKNQSNTYYRLYFNKNDTIKIGKYMYSSISKDSLFLSRKMNRFNLACIQKM